MNRRTLLKGGVVAAAVGAVGMVGYAVLDAGGGRSGDVEPVRTDTVVIPGEWVFEPEVIEVPVGTTVTWVNEGAHGHTVTFTDDTGIEFDVELVPDAATTLRFTTPGSFEYFCRYHLPDMVGTVLVVDE